jgi:hypothetical protein
MPQELVVEATASYEWFVQLVEPFAKRVVLAHPGKLRVIAESTRKSDNLDAKLLAGILASGHIPQAYRPTLRQRRGADLEAPESETPHFRGFRFAGRPCHPGLTLLSSQKAKGLRLWTNARHFRLRRI